MGRTEFAIAAAAAASILAASAGAIAGGAEVPRTCDDAVKWRYHLYTNMDQIKVNEWASESGQTVEVWADPAAGDWTMIQLLPLTGEACIFNSGRDWQPTPPGQ